MPNLSYHRKQCLFCANKLKQSSMMRFSTVSTTLGYQLLERHYRGKMKIRNLFKICSWNKVKLLWGTLCLNNSFNGVMWHEHYMVLPLLWSMGSKQGARERPIINPSGTLSYNVCLTNMPRDKMNGNVMVRVFFHLSVDLYSSDTVYHRWCKNFLTCKKGFPEIVHNTDSLKRGVLKGSSTIHLFHENVQVTQKTASNNKRLS